MASSHHTVAEMQGLYGPFTMAERVLQKIWLQQDFASGAATLSDGRKLEVLAHGRWNFLAGPDFKDARLRIDGREVRGDVEVHFHARDWNAHGHAMDPAFGDVVLHVLLFPPSPDAPPSHRTDGREIPALVLLPLLHRDLEEYAADDALEALTARDDWQRIEELAGQPPEALQEQLRTLAAKRWEAKVASARQRLAKLGWEAAAHHAALEVLGYRQNRVPMLAAAGRWPLPVWREGVQLESVLEAALGWRGHGGRPANHPRTRLSQYQRWVASVPDWPEQLAEWGRAVEVPASTAWTAPTSHLRRSGRFGRLREELWRRIAGQAVGGPRLDTLVCDGFLPLVAAAQGRDDLQTLWFHWFAGDLPDAVCRNLQQLFGANSRDHPLCHGAAQGLLAWLIEREIRA